MSCDFVDGSWSRIRKHEEPTEHTNAFSTCLTAQTTRSYSQMLKQAGLAQLVERAIRNRKVIGSTPIAGSS